VEKLVEDGIFTKNERKNIVEYGLNFRKREVYDYLVIAEKQKMMGCLNKDMIIKTLFDKVSAFFDADTFIIFGSSALDAKKASDIDLLIIGRKDVSKALKEFEEIYNKRVHAIKIRDLKHIKPELMIELYKKHIILNDTERIIRLFGGLHEKNKLV
ncbi:MAG: nucleotidyltransferase domain-containing protein, partial [Candidatus Woesearchaeota archaeon]|nr:nucleotidyltransferase domain-containing protein [Candidatus Woesearchaeota archaeon]